jgi:hypothetical protein
MLDSDCDACHSAPDRFPVLLGSSSGGNGLEPIGCTGCHGRNEDAGPNSDRAAGLRQHHYRAGVTICTDCHDDADPANFTPVGENVQPSYYFTPDPAHPNKPTDSCNLGGEENFAGAPQGLDNDGDTLYDGNDPDCAAGPICATDGRVTTGLQVENNFSFTCDDDQSYWGAQGATFAFAVSSPVHVFELTYPSPTTQPGGITLDLNAKKSAQLGNESLVGRAQIWNATTSTWVDMAGIIFLPLNDISVTFTASGNLAEYVDANDLIKIRLRVVQTGGAANIRTQIDQAVLNVQ